MFDAFRDVFDNVDIDYAPSLRSFQNIYHLFSMAINLIIYVGFSVGIIVIAYSMFMYVVSGGNPDKTKQAWQTFIYGVIAAAVTLAAVALKEIILRTFGVETIGITELEQGQY